MSSALTYPPTPTIYRPTTPPISTSTLATDSSTTLLPFPSSGILNNASTVMVASGPNDVLTATKTPQPPGMVVAATTGATGMFGVAANLDPLIIFGLVVGGLILLCLIGALIYCCYSYCGVPTRQDYIRANDRRSSLHSIQIVEDDLSGAYPVILRGRTTPGSVRSVRKKYLYPADSIGVANGLTYNTVGPNVITLGDGYVTGRSLRLSGSRYGGSGRIVFYDDD